MGLGKGTGNFRERFERGLGLDFDVDDGLRVVLEAFHKRFDFPMHGDERGDFDGGEEAVARRAVVKKDDVAGLFAAEDVAAAEHLFEDVAVANGGAGESDTFAGEGALEAEIGHGSGDDAIAVELAERFEVARGSKQDAVAIDDFSRLADEKRAVGVAIERNAKFCPLGDDALLQTFQIKRAAIGIDVATVGFDGHSDDIGSERREKRRAEFVRRAVGAVENDSKA